MKTVTKLVAFFAVFVLAAVFATANVAAYGYYHSGYHSPNYWGYGPHYSTGFHHYTYSYGWSGWGYNRVHYSFHRPYYRGGYYGHSYPYVTYNRPWYRGWYY